MCAEEIKISFDRDTRACNELKRFETGISYLHAGSVLAVLHDCIVQLQFPLSCQHVVSAKTRIVKLTGDPEFPIVVRPIDQRWSREDPLKSQRIGD